MTSKTGYGLLMSHDLKKWNKNTEKQLTFHAQTQQKE